MKCVLLCAFLWVAIHTRYWESSVCPRSVPFLRALGRLLQVYSPEESRHGYLISPKLGSGDGDT